MNKKKFKKGQFVFLEKTKVTLNGMQILDLTDFAKEHGKQFIITDFDKSQLGWQYELSCIFCDETIAWIYEFQLLSMDEAIEKGYYKTILEENNEITIK